MKKISAIVIFTLVFSSCSLKYGSTVSVEDSVPEFSFKDTTFTRIEDSKVSLELQAETLEQYKGGNNTFARDVEFSIYNKEGELSTTGSCGYLGADTSTKIYNLHDNIYIDSPEQDLKVRAKNLKWDGNTEQLTSGRNDTVTVETNDVTVIGSGFSASGVSKSYSFTGMVSGDITQEDAEEEGLEE